MSQLVDVPDILFQNCRKLDVRSGVAIVGMIAASSSLGHGKVVRESDIKMPERKYIIPPDEDTDEDDDEEITLSEMEVDDEEAGGREEEQNEDRNGEEIENMELLEVSTEGGGEDSELGSYQGDQGDLEPEVELLEVSTDEVDLGSNKGDYLEEEFDPDEDMEEALVIDEEDEEREEGDEKEDEEREVGGEKDEKIKSGGRDEWKPLELLPAGWKFKETPRHDGGKEVFCFPQYPK